MRRKGLQPTRDMIAAAPDLVDALKQAVWLMDRLADWDSSVGYPPITAFAARRHATEWRQVIADAEGRDA